jgi:transposase
MSYSVDLRDRVTQAVSAGQSRRQVAERFAVGVSTAIRWAARAEAEGSARARKTGRRPGKGPLVDHRAYLIAQVEAKPDITMPELAARLKDVRGVEAHPASISRLLCRAGFTYKKTADGLGVRTR